MKKKNRNNLKRLLISIFIFLVLCFAIDFIIGKTLQWLYFSQESGLQYRTTYALEETKAGAIVFGSSRANHHYVPAEFERQLNLPFYNAGRDGTSIFYHYAILKGILKRYKPEVIILDILKDELEFRQDSYDRLSELLPYYNKHPEIRSIVALKSPYEQYKMVSKIYPYNSSLLTILMGNTDYNKKRQQDIQGYIPLSGSYAGSLKADVSETYGVLDSKKIDIYKSFIQDCKNNNIALYIVVSPNLIKYGENETIDLAGRIAREHGIPFLDFSEDPAFLGKRAYFSDPEHLNDAGARLFSGRMADALIGYLAPEDASSDFQLGIYESFNHSNK